MSRDSDVRGGPQTMGKRISVSILLASIVALSLLAVVPRAAHGCSCSWMYSPLSEYANEVDVAFSGRQVERGGDFWDVTVLTFEVDRVYKGPVGPRVELYTSLSSSCGIDFGPFGATGVAAFIAGPESTELWVHWCGSLVSIEELEEVFGAGYPPDEGYWSTLPETSTTAIHVDEVEFVAESDRSPNSTQPTPGSTRTENQREDSTSRVDHSTESVTSARATGESSDTGTGSTTITGLSDYTDEVDVAIEELEEVFGAGYPPDRTIVLPEPAEDRSATLIALPVCGALILLAIGVIALRLRRRRAGGQ